MTPQDMAAALKVHRETQQKVELEFEYERIHAPLAQTITASVVVGNKLKVFAIGGSDLVTQLAHDLFVETKGQMTGEECMAKSREFYGAVGRDAMQMAATMAAQEAELPQETPGENGDSGILLP